jgi:hypothetical protein
MESSKTTARALFRFALVAAASVAAASIWAQTQARAGEGYMLNAETWSQEVNAAGTLPWPADGWWRLVPHDKSIEVRAVKPGDTGIVPADAIYLRLPGATIQPGTRRAYRQIEVLQQPRLGQDYELTLGATRFSLRVDSGDQGLQYAIGYGGQTYQYVLGSYESVRTSVRAVADLDGDSQPDFLVDVDDATYLLLSTRARPGANLPTAELWAHGC